MTMPQVRPSVRRVPLFTTYVIIWTLLGTVGLGYLGLAIFSPETLDDLTPAGAREGSSVVARTDPAITIEMNGLRDSIAQLQIEVARIKTDVSGQAEHGKTLESQVVALEQRIKANETPVEASDAPTHVPNPAQDQAAATAAAQSTGAEAVSPAAPAAKVINADKPAERAPANTAPIVTGSVSGTEKAKPQATLGPAVVKPAAKPIGLQLGSGPSIDNLRLNWTVLADRHADTLAKLQPRFVLSGKGEGDTPNYNLIAGPVKTKAEAIKICKELLTDDVVCKVGEFRGDAL